MLKNKEIIVEKISDLFQKFLGWFKESKKNKAILAGCVAGCIAVVCCLVLTVRYLTMSDDKKAELLIPDLVNQYVDAMNKEDIDAYLSCVKLDDITVAKNQSSLKIIFEVYDLKTTVKSIDVTSIDASEGIGSVRVVTHVTNQSETSYKDCDNTTDFELVYDSKKDKWCLGKSSLINVAYTGEN